ncbi:MAG: A/G-specific adenine glycosylase, partial [Cellulomonas sp.]|nr:A/G-specific adenine glycosylase [Cellulomonas sp.]
RWALATMELGALVCTARAPRCEACPLASSCAWLTAGRPPDEHAHRRRGQPWEGTDRQVRGRVMALLRGAIGPVPADAVAAVWPDARQLTRCVEALVADGLVVPLTVTGATAGPDDEPASYRLP